MGEGKSVFAAGEQIPGQWAHGKVDSRSFQCDSDKISGHMETTKVERDGLNDGKPQFDNNKVEDAAGEVDCISKGNND